jgi:hypothetical protein
MPADRLALAGMCPVCGRQVPGMASPRYSPLVLLDFHLHPVWYLGFCIGSRTHMPKIRKTDLQISSGTQV